MLPKQKTQLFFTGNFSISLLKQAFFVQVKEKGKEKAFWKKNTQKKGVFFLGAKERIHCYLKKCQKKGIFLHTPLPIPTGLVHPLTSKKQDNSSTKKEVVILSPSLLRATPSPRKLQEILSEGIHFFLGGRGQRSFVLVKMEIPECSLA